MVNRFQTFRTRLKNQLREANRCDLIDEIWKWFSGVTGKERAYLLTHDHEIIFGEDHILSIMKRRLAGEPLAYIFGNAVFYGRDFNVGEGVLIPRPDSEIVIEVLLAFLGLENDRHILTDQKNPRRHIIPADSLFFYDLCTGSGCLGITAFLELSIRGMKSKGRLIDISGKALRYTSENIQKWEAGNFLFPVQTDLTEGQDKKADFILSNPPYIPEAEIAGLMPEVSCFEPKIALDGGGDGLLFYRRVLKESLGLLMPGGALIMEHGYNQGADVAKLFYEHGLCLVTTIQDYGGHERVTFGIKGIKTN